MNQKVIASLKVREGKWVTGAIDKRVPPSPVDGCFPCSGGFQ